MQEEADGIKGWLIAREKVVRRPSLIWAICLDFRDGLGQFYSESISSDLIKQGGDNMMSTTLCLITHKFMWKPWLMSSALYSNTHYKTSVSFPLQLWIHKSVFSIWTCFESFFPKASFNCLDTAGFVWTVASPLEHGQAQGILLALSGLANRVSGQSFSFSPFIFVSYLFAQSRNPHKTLFLWVLSAHCWLP